MRAKGLVVLSWVCLTAAGCGGSSKSAVNNQPAPYPSIPGTGGGTLNANRNFAFLQQHYASAVISPAPWAGYWFPYQSDGIADAASLYDAATGGSATRWEVAHHGQGLGNVADWWGHCNGWTAAAILTPEPRSSVSAGGQTFGIADRKALLTETFMEVSGDFIGTRVDDPSDTSSEAFNDVWPAQMYLVLTSLMGIQRRAVAIDRYTGYQVWNQPMVAYKTEPTTPADYLGPDPQFPNIYRVNVTTTIWWVNDNVDPGSTTPAFDGSSGSDVFQSRTLMYELWLDAPPRFDASGKLVSSGDIILSEDNGHVTGGIWKNAALPLVESHPDYMWVPTGPAASTGFKNPQLDDSWVLSHMN